MPQNEKIYQTAIGYLNTLPHNQALGLKFEYAHGRKQVLSVAWREDLVGNPKTGVIHGGVITALVDVAGGASVAAHLDDFELLVTLDLRIDYLHPATPQEKIYAQSECYKLTDQVAFVRTTCFHQDREEDPIAFAMATYMRTPISDEIKEQLK
ncbi:PaaI family thioesterase [Neisseria sp. Ec49-e6-T10]|uniref:PaaI family thioesterase n=1 Tax=Neisseria sp. Ec49-e6-T10 TaxID=3140744 RepID=UPI003EC0FEB3